MIEVKSGFTTLRRQARAKHASRDRRVSRRDRTWEEPEFEVVEASAEVTMYVYRR